MRIAPLVAGVLIVVLASPAAADHGGLIHVDGGEEGDTDVVYEQGELYIEASTPESMTLVNYPGYSRGTVIRCGWYDIEWVDLPSVLILVPVRPTVPGDWYILNCWYPTADDWDTSNNVPGFPDPRQWFEYLPPEVVNSYEVAEFAYDSIPIAQPQAVLSPAAEHIVGIETWLALGSELEYDAVSAQAGNVWATVQPVFSHVVWDLGNGDTATCDDATTFWDPDGFDGQTSGCTYLFEADNDGEPFEGTVSAYWNVLQDTSDPLDPPVWGIISRTAAISFNVRELQAVINR